MSQQITFQLETLSCPSCIKKIESAVSSQAGVQDVKVLFNASKVKATIDESQIQAEQIKSTIENLGFGVLKTSAA